MTPNNDPVNSFHCLNVKRFTEPNQVQTQPKIETACCCYKSWGKEYSAGNKTSTSRTFEIMRERIKGFAKYANLRHKPLIAIYKILETLQR